MEDMLDTLTWQQLACWNEYALLEPFGEERADLRAGIIAAVLANANRDPSKSDPFTPQDFMPDFDGGREDEKRKPVTTQEQWQSVKQQALAYAKSGVLGEGARDPGDDPAYLQRVRAAKLASMRAAGAGDGVDAHIR